jgi:hypothetical protein
VSVRDLLILRHAEVSERFEQLARRLGEDAPLRKLYVHDPARVIAGAVFPKEEIPSAEIDRGSRLLFSLLSNEEFRKWANDYQAQLVRQALEATELDDPYEALRTQLAITDRANLHRDLAEAIARHADPALIASLTWETQRSAADVAVEIETFVYAVAAAAVFVVVVLVVFLGVEEDFGVIPAFSRGDVLALTRQLASELQAHAEELRVSGALTELEGLE